MVEYPKGLHWMKLSMVKDYYLYSLIPQEYEFKFWFGDNYLEHYQSAVRNQRKPTLSGFISYCRKTIIDMEKISPFALLNEKGQKLN